MQNNQNQNHQSLEEQVFLLQEQARKSQEMQEQLLAQQNQNQNLLAQLFTLVQNMQNSQNKTETAQAAHPTQMNSLSSENPNPIQVVHDQNQVPREVGRPKR